MCPARFRGQAGLSAECGLATGPLGRLPWGWMNLRPLGSQRPPGLAVGVRLFFPPTVAEQWGAGWGIPCTAKDGIRNNSAPALNTVHWSQQVTAPPARWPASCSGFSTHGLSQRCTGNRHVGAEGRREEGPDTQDPSALKEPAAGNAL